MPSRVPKLARILGSDLVPERRKESYPDLERLCREYGGITRIPIPVALKVLSYESWDVFIERTEKDRVDRLTDQTPVVECLRR